MRRSFVLLFLLCLPIPLFPQNDQQIESNSLSIQLYLEAKNLEKGGASQEALATYQKSLNEAQEAGDQRMIAKNWLAMGGLHTLLGNHDQARKFLEDGKSLANQLNEKEIIATALIWIGDLEQRQSKYQESMEIGIKALEIGKELNNSELICRALRVIGNNFYYQGKFTEAFEKYELSLQHALKTEDPKMVAVSLLVIGNTLTDMGKPEEAIQRLLEALKKAEESGDKTLQHDIHSSLGSAYGDLGLREESLKYYKQGLLAAEEFGDKSTKAALLNNIGIVYREFGLHDQALHYYQESLKLAEELKVLKGVGILLNNIGALYFEEGLQEKALSYFERSMKIREQIGDQWGIASVLNNMGLLYEKQKKYDLSIECQEKALKIAEETGNKQRINHYSINLGEAYLLKGSYKEARQLFHRALKISEENKAKDLTGFALEGLGRVSAELKEYPDAISSFQQAVIIGKNLKRPDLLSRSQMRLGEVYIKSDEPLKALPLFKSAIAEIESVRARASSEEGKSQFLATQLGIYEKTISTLFETGQGKNRESYKAQAFEYSERAKARALLDSLGEARSAIMKGLSKEQRDRQSAILRKISKLQSKLLNASADQEVKTLDQELLKAEGELDRFILDLRIRNPAYAQVQYPKPHRLDQLQQQLDKKTALLEYFIGPERSYVFAVTSNTIEISAIPKLQIEELVRKLRDRISRPPTAAFGQPVETPQREYREQAKSLFQLTIAPIRKSIEGKRNLILVADGILHYVPFEALIDEEDRLLIENYHIVYAPSATVWANLKDANPAHTMRKELLAFANPLTSSINEVAADDDREFRLGMLPYAGLEVEEITSLYPAELTELHLSKDATEGKLKSDSVSDYKIIHFATHALINEEAPRRSGIILASGGADEDGFLQMHEVWNLDLNATLIVLSACQTGLGKLVSGEGMIGLMRSFFYAGAKNVVVSLWNVDDKSASRLMKNFYVHMTSGKTIIESLRQAKLDMIHSARSGSGYAAHQDPYYWAPFILSGPGN